MSSSQFKTFAFVGFAAITIVSFQNCAPTNFAGTEGLNKNTVQATLPASVVDPSIPTFVDPIKGAPIESSPGASTPTSTASADVLADHTERERETAKYYRGICEKARGSKNLLVLADGLSLKGLSGVNNFSANSFAALTESSGHIVLANRSAQRGAIGVIRAVSGTTIVCNLDVELIDRRSGSLVIVDGDVGDIRDSSGLIIIGGKVTGKVTNSSGTYQQIAARK